MTSRLTFAVCGLSGPNTVCGGVEGTLPTTGLTPLRLIKANRTRNTFANVTFPILTTFTWNWKTDQAKVANLNHSFYSQTTWNIRMGLLKLASVSADSNDSVDGVSLD